jgi:NADPH:quinone reductase-like Zn-dependent oxidoreductase
MNAIVQHAYGSPDVLQLAEVPTPTPGDGEVLVRVRAASVNAGDWHLMRADPFFLRLMYGGLLHPKHQILGSDVAGTVEAVGPGVTAFEPGDDVFGDVSGYGFGAFAEYVAAPTDAFVPLPAGAMYEQAAAVPVAGLAALQALRDDVGVGPGDRVLVNGASGGVGTFAVQIAKHFGAEVTGVCSTRNVDLVRSLGADRVVDYTRADVTGRDERYDLVLDAAAFRSPLAYRPLLAPGGAYVLIGGSTARFFQTMLLGPWVRRHGIRMAVHVSKPNRDDLAVLKGLVERGAVTPAIDRTYPLAEVPDAIRRLEARRVRGKVVISV